MSRAKLSPTRRSPRRGLSIVELMVGITIGLFILAGATMVLTTQLGDNRRLLLEAQVQQDLRATADLISRDIRAAGYWPNAYKQLWPAPGAVAPTNPYAVTPLATTANGSSLVYYRSRDEEEVGKTVFDVVDSNEQGGFRLNTRTGAIEVQLGDGNWQQLTDPNVMTVTRFNLVLASPPMPVPCGVACPVGPTGCQLYQKARSVVLTIMAQAVHDTTVQRKLTNTIRLRNDVVQEVC